MGRKETVTRVIDGTTFRTASRKNPVRLADVNAPEMGQYGGDAARRALREMIRGETVLIESVGRDRHGCSVAQVYKNEESVNQLMIESCRAEAEARAQKVAAAAAGEPEED